MAADVTETVPEAPWWGWAPQRPDGGVPEGIRRVLRERFGAELPAGTPPVAAADAVLPEPVLSAAARAALAAAVGAPEPSGPEPGGPGSSVPEPGGPEPSGPEPGGPGSSVPESSKPAGAPAPPAGAGSAPAPRGSVSQRHEDRLRHAAGKHTPDLIRQRAGRPIGAPDAVVRPASTAAIPAVLAACVQHRVAVVPFGGGTSVVGGVAPLRGAQHAVIALDLTGLTALRSLNETDRTATFEAGIRGPALEAALAVRGFTLGHLPQSHQQATLGGYAATRSAGQASTGYGAIADLITGIRIETPSGPLELGGRGPASAAGPDLRQLVIGSEGTLGVITEVTVAIRPRPTQKAYGSWAFPSFAAGAEAVRALVQHGSPGDLPEVCRLSDEEETALTLAQSAGTGTALLRRWLGVRGIHTPALLLGVWEGTDARVRGRRGRAAKILRRHGGVPTTGIPAAAWDTGRFGAPRLRDELLTLGVFVDTLETAAPWSRLDATHRAIAEAIRGALVVEDPGAAPRPATSAPRATAVQGHVSHVYRDGASLYFTFIAPAEADPIAQYERVKRAANAAILAQGATITHHHAVGTEHAAMLGDEIGPLGVRVLRAVRAEVDPTGIMNPGKLLGDGNA